MRKTNFFQPSLQSSLTLYTAQYSFDNSSVIDSLIPHEKFIVLDPNIFFIVQDEEKFESFEFFEIGIQFLDKLMIKI